MKISFDLDSTLDITSVQSFAKMLIKAGYEVWIVTSRKKESVKRPNWNDDLFEVADIVGIKRKNIHFTEMDDKFKFLKENDFDIHVDDDVIELSLIEDFTNCMPVCHLEWGKKYGGKKEWKKLILEL